MPLVSTTRFCSLFLSFICGLATAHAQADVDPIEFAYVYPRIGGELGLVPTWQSGSYRTGCGDFSEGGGLNPNIAVAYDRPFGEGEIRVELLGGWHSRSVTSTFNRRETVVLQTGNGTARVDVDFENEGTLTTSYLTLMPSVKYYPLETFYLGGGAMVGLVTGATAQYRKIILTKTAVVPGIGLAEISYPESESSEPYIKIFEAEERQDRNGFAFDIALYAGAEFPLGQRMMIGPRLTYAIPLTAVLSNPELKLNTVHLTIGLRYALFR